MKKVMSDYYVCKGCNKMYKKLKNQNKVTIRKLKGTNNWERDKTLSQYGYSNEHIYNQNYYCSNECVDIYLALKRI